MNILSYMSIKWLIYHDDSANQTSTVYKSSIKPPPSNVPPFQGKKVPLSVKPPPPCSSHNYSSLINDWLYIYQSQLLNSVQTDPGWFIYQMEVQIWFWSSAAWPPTSCTWAFLLYILVLYEELIPSSFLNWISPPPPPKWAWNNNRVLTEIVLSNASVFNSLTYMFPLLSGTGYKTMSKPIIRVSGFTQ